MLLNPSKEEEIYNCLSCIYGTFSEDELCSFCEFSNVNQVNHLKLNNDKIVFVKPSGKQMIQKW